MAKSPTTPEFKIQVCERYLKGEGSFNSLAEEYGIDKATVRRWEKISDLRRVLFSEIIR